MNNNELREQLAALCHDQWSGWMKYLFSKCQSEYINNNPTGNFIMPEWSANRWQRQVNTPYSELSHEEKESDRKEADKFIKLIGEYSNEEIKWCMCERIGEVARDMYSTCSRCGGRDAYGESKQRPKNKRKTIDNN